MARNKRPLTATKVDALEMPGRHSVGTVAGLHLRILPPPSPTRVWTLRVVVGGRRRDVGLGWYPDEPRSPRFIGRAAYATPHAQPAPLRSSFADYAV